MTSSRALLKKHVKGSYGQWLLVHLPSGRWARVWHACLDLPEMCESILAEVDWFYDEVRFHGPNPSFVTRGEALQWLIRGIEEQMRNEQRIGGSAEMFEAGLKKARMAALRNKVEPGRAPDAVVNEGL